MTWLNPKFWISIGIILFCVGVTVGWETNGAIKNAQIAQRDQVIAARDQELLQQIIDSQEAAAQQRTKDAHIRDLRDAKVAADAALDVAQAKVIQAGKVQSTSARVKYVTQDSNATTCGFTSRGVYAWNSAASCGRLPETEAASTGTDGGPITARNADIAEAAELSFSAHCDALLQIKRLQNYIRNECLPVVE